MENLDFWFVFGTFVVSLAAAIWLYLKWTAALDWVDSLIEEIEDAEKRNGELETARDEWKRRHDAKAQLLREKVENSGLKKAFLNSSLN